jgi:hypothetical protein
MALGRAFYSVSSLRKQGTTAPPHRLSKWVPAFAGLITAGACSSSFAQEAGWHYSPLPGEGDRATLGCSYGATPQSFTCLAVRCEEDYSVGIHIHTSRAESDIGNWVLEFDKEGQRIPVTAVPGNGPYHARIAGEAAPILDLLKNSGLVYLDPADGPPIDRAISLSGSLTAINQALYFCAPRMVTPPPSGDEVSAVDGHDGPGDVAREGAAEE